MYMEAQEKVHLLRNLSLEKNQDSYQLHSFVRSVNAIREIQTKVH